MVVEKYGYLIALITALSLLAICDWRYKLALWANPKLYVAIVFGAIPFFLLWDAVNLSAGIFQFDQITKYSYSFVIAGHRFPIEELLFFVLLNYQTVLLWRYYQCYRMRS